jgi:hypothetical protein
MTLDHKKNTTNHRLAKENLENMNSKYLNEKEDKTTAQEHYDLLNEQYMAVTSKTYENVTMLESLKHRVYNLTKQEKHYIEKAEGLAHKITELQEALNKMAAENVEEKIKVQVA